MYSWLRNLIGKSEEEIIPLISKEKFLEKERIIDLLEQEKISRNQIEFERQMLYFRENVLGEIIQNELKDSDTPLSELKLDIHPISGSGEEWRDNLSSHEGEYRKNYILRLDGMQGFVLSSFNRPFFVFSFTVFGNETQIKQIQGVRFDYEKALDYEDDIVRARKTIKEHDEWIKKTGEHVKNKKISDAKELLSKHIDHIKLYPKDSKERMSKQPTAAQHLKEPRNILLETVKWYAKKYLGKSRMTIIPKNDVDFSELVEEDFDNEFDFIEYQETIRKKNYIDYPESNGFVKKGGVYTLKF